MISSRCRVAIVVVALGVSVLSGCQTRRASAPPPQHSGSGTHWSYEGETGPSHWGSLSPEYALCATGKRQSPVNIAGTVPRDLPNVEFYYAPTPLEIVNNGHTIQVNYAPGSFIVLDHQRFDLVQFHFHSPSEHKVNGRASAAEMHLVHKSESGELAVVGVLIEEGAYNAKFEPLWRSLPREPGPPVRVEAQIDATDLLPRNPCTYRYEGSLTTPPGTEGVRWCLMTEPVRLARTQIEDFRAIIHGNNRPVQPHNGRVIVRDVTP